MVVNEDAAAVVQAYHGWNKKETFGHDISRRLKELDTQIKKLSPRSRSDINNHLKQVEAKITKLSIETLETKIESLSQEMESDSQEVKLEPAPEPAPEQEQRTTTPQFYAACEALQKQLGQNYTSKSQGRAAEMVHELGASQEEKFAKQQAYAARKQKMREEMIALKEEDDFNSAPKFMCVSCTDEFFEEDIWYSNIPGHDNWIDWLCVSCLKGIARGEIGTPWRV